MKKLRLKLIVSLANKVERKISSGTVSAVQAFMQVSDEFHGKISFGESEAVRAELMVRGIL